MSRNEAGSLVHGAMTEHSWLDRATPANAEAQPRASHPAADT